MAYEVRVRTGTTGEWSRLGSGYARGIVPEGLSCSADEHGSTQAGFTLRRLTTTPWPDLTAGNQVEIDVDGITVWSGRIKQTPSSGADSIGVACEGWQYHLDDDQIALQWVNSSVKAGQDGRNSAADLTVMVASGKVINDGTGLAFGWDAGSSVPGTSKGVSVVWDMGPGGWNRAMIDFVQVGNDANLQYYIIGSDSPYWSHASRLDALSAVATTSYAVGTQYTIGGSLAGSATRRYAHFLLFYTGPGGIWSAPDKITKVVGARFSRLARDLNGSSPFQSLLVASNVVTDVINAGATPMLSTDTSQITATSFVLPEFAPDGYRTPRQIIESVNAFHDYQYAITVDRRLSFKPRASTPTMIIGEWSGASFSDSSLGNLDDLYNKVIVEYTAADGSPAVEARTASSGILSRQGFTRTHQLAVGITLTQTAAQQIGDIWLTRHSVAPLAGAFTASRGSVRTLSGSTPVPPSQLLLRVGERTAIGQPDPQTGDPVRNGAIVGVTYQADTDTAQVQLDNNTTSIEAWLSRLAVIQGSR